VRKTKVDAGQISEINLVIIGGEDWIFTLLPEAGDSFVSDDLPPAMPPPSLLRAAKPVLPLRSREAQRPFFARLLPLGCRPLANLHPWLQRRQCLLLQKALRKSHPRQ
jgi:hypothetical protein